MKKCKYMMWLVILSLACLLFLIGLQTHQYTYSIGAMLLGILVRICGNEYFKTGQKERN